MSATLVLQLDDELSRRIKFIANREVRTPEEQVMFFLKDALELYFADPLAEEEYICSPRQEPEEPGIPF